MPRLILNTGREKSLLRRHPWVFTGAVSRLDGDPRPGDTVRVEAGDGRFLGHAAYSPSSQIVARVWDWHEATVVNADFFRNRLALALAARRGGAGHAPGGAVDGANGAQRLVNAESDGLPGLIADRYGDFIVLQLLSTGVERWRETIASLLLELTGARGVYERSDAEVRELEGLPARGGRVLGDEPPEVIEIAENGLRFEVNVRTGHKTGFYLDQRDNRARLRGLAQGRAVLDAFCYSGGFATAALAGGASAVTAVEASADALELARRNAALNGFTDAAEWLQGDVFQMLRLFRDQGRHFDLIVLDPPKFAPTAGAVDRACRGYKDINLLAFKLLTPGGHLLTFSCSGGLSTELFQKVVADAALDAGVEAHIQARLQAAPDHPIGLNFPEGSYLKGLHCRRAGL